MSENVLDLVESVRVALAELAPGPVDKAAADLALRYAAAIDAGACGCQGCPSGDLVALGPKLLMALMELGMTPRARAAVKEGADGGATGRLDELRQRRRARQGGASPGDAAPS